MPRKTDPQKEEYAKLLLSQGIPIAKIRKELKNFFESSISPNRLINLKKEIEEEPALENKDSIANLIPNLFRKEQVAQELDKINELSERMRQNTILIQKLWNQFNQLQHFFNFLSPIIQNINEKFEKIEIFDSNKRNLEYDEISDDLLLTEIGKRKAKIANILASEKEMNLSEIEEKSGIDYRILKWGLSELLEMGIIEEFEKNDYLFYKNSEFLN